MFRVHPLRCFPVLWERDKGDDSVLEKQLKRQFVRSKNAFRAPDQNHVEREANQANHNICRSGVLVGLRDFFVPPTHPGEECDVFR